MDEDEDLDLLSKTPAPPVKTAWVSIGAYHVINQSYRRITNVCRSVLGFIAFKGPWA